VAGAGLKNGLKRGIATLLLAGRVRPSARFAVRQLRGVEGTHGYSVRGTGRRILIRHRSDDPYVLAECFGRLARYEPPIQVAELLARRPPKSVLDLGANIGLFGLLALDRYPGARVTGVEADPANAELHERMIGANELRDRWRVEPAFASTEDGRARFASGRSSRSRAAGAGEESVGVAAVDVLPLMAEADLVKIDIEGAEWKLLADPRLPSLTATAIVLEYHRHDCPPGDPGEAACRALERAGYTTLAAPRDPVPTDGFEGLGMLWAWRES
jgi:FkbM family methyltransferase